MRRTLTAAQREEAEAQRAIRRHRRVFFHSLVAAFWPRETPPAIAGSTPSVAWWSQRDYDAEDRPVAAAGEIADR